MQQMSERCGGLPHLQCTFIHRLILCPVAFAGLWYLTLYLSTRFRVVPLSAVENSNVRQRLPEGDEAHVLLIQNDTEGRNIPSYATKVAGASTSAYLLPLPYVPLGLAIFIAGTRYFDFRNHGCDVLAGSAVGTITSWWAFRMYHPPVSSSARRGMGTV